MANQLSAQTGPSARNYRKYLRRGRFAQIKGGMNQFSAWLAAMGAKLTLTPTQVYDRLKKNSADRIQRATSTSDLA